MDTILITGISGFLGWNLAERLKGAYRIYGTYLDHPVDMDGCEMLAFDLMNLDRIARLCEAIHPKVIVHAAALSDPDLCELERKPALTLNTFATRELAKCASILGAKLVFLSSALVFDGARGMYVEADIPNPLNYFAKTKHLAELEITNNCGNYVTLRLSPIYGRGRISKQSPFDQMEQLLEGTDHLRLPTDQFFSPLYIGDVLETVWEVVAGRGLKGLFHLGGPQRLSAYQFGEMCCAALGLPVERLVACRAGESGRQARLPRDCSLDSRKAREILKLQGTMVHQGLERLAGSVGRDSAN